MSESKQEIDAPKAAEIAHVGPKTWITPKNTPENWKIAEKKKNIWRNDEKEFYNALQKLAQLKKKKEDSRLDFFKHIPETDGTLLEESPMATTILNRAFRMNMSAFGFPWAAQLMVAPEMVAPYMNQVDEGISWAMKKAGAEALV